MAPQPRLGPCRIYPIGSAGTTIPDRRSDGLRRHRKATGLTIIRQPISPPVGHRGERHQKGREDRRTHVGCLSRTERFPPGWCRPCPDSRGPFAARRRRRDQPAVRELITRSPAYYNKISIEPAARLTDLSGLNQVFFENSGAEANEGAIKLARKYDALHRGGAYEIITFDGALHLRTLRGDRAPLFPVSPRPFERRRSTIRQATDVLGEQKSRCSDRSSEALSAARRRAVRSALGAAIAARNRNEDAHRGVT
jgi:Aminotransferase class-III